MSARYFRTYTGRRVYPLAPNPSEIDIEDVGHSLARLCRFLGHTREDFYSVAQHSVLVSELVPAEDAMWGLLHDASEAYLADLPAPIKREPEMEIYRVAEDRLMRAVAARFGLLAEMPQSVKCADRLLLATEFRDVTTVDDPEWIRQECGCEPSSTIIIVPWPPLVAEYKFFERFAELFEMTPKEFIELLWQYKPEEQYILIWTLPDKKSRWFRDVAEAGVFATNVNFLDVYVGLGLSKENFGPMRRCRSDEVSGICGIGTDLDLKSAAHGTKPLPATLADALSIMPVSMPPTIIIATGNGAHAWWLFKEPLVFDSEEERADTQRLLARWHTMLRLTSASRGWVYDRLSDLARVLRIPGTKNHKDPSNPKDVTVHSRTGRFYNVSDFEEFLDAAGIPDPEAEERAAREWKERFADKPLVINPAARIPEELLAMWMDPQQVDPQTALKFRNTWNRQRHDLKDQSGSGYDLALACFGVDAGLSEQQIVDLICHHRAFHHQRQRTTLDYYQRTIAKAEKRTGGSADARPAIPGLSPAPTNSPVAPRLAQDAADRGDGTETTGAPPAAPDPETKARRKALLCERISRALTVPVVRLVKITGKEPQYRMELGSGHKIEFPHVNKLLAYDSVRSAFAATAGRIIPKIKGKEWEALSQVMLDACIIEEGTEEMEWDGATRMYLQHYLAETGFIPTIEGQRLQDQRKPMVKDGQITVCASDLLVYVNKTTYQYLTVKAIAGMLSALGAKSIRVRSRKFKEQSRWVLPLSEFDPAEYGESQSHTGEADAAE